MRRLKGQLAESGRSSTAHAMHYIGALQKKNDVGCTSHKACKGAWVGMRVQYDISGRPCGAGSVGIIVTQQFVMRRDRTDQNSCVVSHLSLIFQLSKHGQLLSLRVPFEHRICAAGHGVDTPSMYICVLTCEVVHIARRYAQWLLPCFKPSHPSIAQ